MPITIDYDRKENVIYSKAEGVINIDHIMSYFSSVALLDLRKGYRVYADYSDASLELSNADVQKIADTRKAIQNPGDKLRIAVLAKDDLVFALARMYETAAAGSWVATVPPYPARYRSTKALYPFSLIASAYGNPS